MTIKYTYLRLTFSFSVKYHILISTNGNSKGRQRLICSMPYISYDLLSVVMGYRSLHQIEMTPRELQLSWDWYCELMASFSSLCENIRAIFFLWPELSPTHFFSFHLTQVKIILEVKIIRGLGRRVTIYFFGLYSWYQNTLNLAVSEAHTCCQLSNPHLCLPVLYRSKMVTVLCTSLPTSFGRDLWH